MWGFFYFFPGNFQETVGLGMYSLVMYGPLYPSFNLIAGINGNPSKLIVTLKGQAKSSQSSVAGIYTLEPKPINDKSHWLQNYVPSRGNTSSNAIWCKKNGIWAIGEIGRVGYIFSFDKLSSPEEATTWHYWNGSNFIASDDILVEAKSKAGTVHSRFKKDFGSGQKVS